MPAFRLNIKVDQKGAIYNASTVKADAARMTVEINEKLAQEGVRRVKARLGQVLQHPTGYYESQIAVERRQTYRGVWDQGVIYGPWLEGTSSRNKTTRFKGYRTFRVVQQELQLDSRELAEPYVNKYVAKMSG